MRQVIVPIGFLFFSACFILVGVAALALSPDKCSQLWHRWRNTPLMDKEATGVRHETTLALQIRLFGCASLLAGIVLASITFSWFVHPISSPSAHGASSSPAGGLDWAAFGLAIVIVLGGLYVLIKPEHLLRWSINKLPFRLKSDEKTVRSWIVAIRIMGLFMVYRSIDLFRLWLKR
jgi:hypothetical protein